MICSISIMRCIISDMKYLKEVIHSPKRFEQWHLSPSILEVYPFRLAMVRHGGYGLHDIDFYVERISSRGFSAVVITLSGRGRFTMEDETSFLVHPGDVFVSSASGQGHREETEGPEPWEQLWLLFSDNSGIIPDSIDDYDVFQIDSKRETSFIRELVRNIIDEDLYEGSTSLKSIELSAELLLLIIQRAIRPAGNTESRLHHSQLAALWSEVAKDMSEPWKVEDLAKMMNCSRSQLTRICNDIYHKSPGQKIREMKMENAKILLSGSSVLIHEVAEAVGFSSLSLFSSSFSSYTGMGPREFRKMKMEEEHSMNRNPGNA